MHRAVVLTTFVILLLAIAGVTAAGPNGDDSTMLTTPEGTTFGSTVPEDPVTTTPGGASSKPEDAEEKIGEDISEPTVITEPTIGESQEPTVVGPVEERPAPHRKVGEEPGRADDVHGLNARGPGNNGRGVGRPEHAGKPPDTGKLRSHATHPPSGKAKEREAKEEHERGEDQHKVTLCHKGKNTLTVGAPAQEAHLRHGDSLGECM